MLEFDLKSLQVANYSKTDYIDVHIIKHPTQDRSKTLEPLLKQLESEPIKVHLTPGYDRMIGRGRYEGFQLGESQLVSYVDDDDEIVPGIYSKILQEFKDEPRIDGLCTREKKDKTNKRMGYGKFRYKYYDRRHFLRTHHISTYRRASIDPFINEIQECPTTSEHTLVAILMLNNAIIKHLPEVGYYWTEHEGSTPVLGMKNHKKSQDLYKKVFAMAAAEKYKSHIEGQGIIR